MSYATSRELRPGRIRFPDLSPRAYEHPADRGALVALRKLKGFDTLLKALSGLFNERTVRNSHDERTNTVIACNDT